MGLPSGRHLAPPGERTAKGRAFSPERLADDFGSKANLAQDGVRALYEAIAAAEHPEARASFKQWKVLFGEVCGFDIDHPSDKLKRLADVYDVPPDGLKPAELLFAVHTYYAIFLDLLASKIVARRANIANFPEGDLFAWHTAIRSATIERAVLGMARRLDDYDPGAPSEDPSGCRDLVKKLYEQLLPRTVRHDLGEYYTPDWLAEHVLDALGYAGDPDKRLLDPACGSGTFLVMAINRIRRWYDENRKRCAFDQGELCRKMLGNVVGFDLNPLAVMAARTNYLIAIRDLVGHVEEVEMPVHLCDSILPASQSALAPPLVGEMDFVAGNPPWVAWDHLPADYRDATKPLWERYGLFTLSAAAARHGGAKKDLSMLMLYASAENYLKAGGKLGFVITQTLFQTKGAGDGFRRFRIGASGDSLGVTRVDDMTAFQPFDGASNWTSTVILTKGRETRYPVPYFRWSPAGQLPTSATADWRACFDTAACEARPIDARRSNSPWIVQPASLNVDAASITGPSDYEAHLGANSGGANGVFWVRILKAVAGGVLVRNISEKSKKPIEGVSTVIEADLLYPLVRWSDVSRFSAVPSAHLLLAQDAARRTGIDEAIMRRKYPKTYAYLKRFHAMLAGRAAYRRYQADAPFYSMYDVDAYTLAPIKVVWRRMDRRINAAVLGRVEDAFLGRRPAVPQETCVLIEAKSADEAHYLCALLNSAVANFIAKSHSVRGGKGFGTPSVLDYLRLRRFAASDPGHRELAGLSRKAHRAAARGRDVAEIQEAIDHRAAGLYGVSPARLQAIRRAAD